MSYVKYTKTSTFLFPLLEIPRSLFSCKVTNSTGGILMTNRFLNSYLNDQIISNTEYNEGPYIYIIVKSNGDLEFESFYDTLTSLENYTEDFEYNDFLIMVFKIPDNYINDYKLLLEGKYSKISDEAKTIIIKHAFYSGKIRTTITKILTKHPSLKLSWEKRLSVNTRVDLKDQEVWGIIEMEKETLTKDILIKNSKKSKMSLFRELKK